MKPEFNDRENYVIAYYRDKNASSALRVIFVDGVRILFAVGLFIYGFVEGDLLWSMIAFGILLFGEIRRLFETSRYMHVYQNIMDKYNDALAEATSRQVRNEEAGDEKDAEATTDDGR